MSWYYLLGNCLLSRYWGTWDVRVEWCGAGSLSVLQQRGGVRLDKPVHVTTVNRRPEKSTENVVLGRVVRQKQRRLIF